MALFVALAFIAGVVYLVSKLKPGTPEDAPFAEARDDDGAEAFDEPEPPGLDGSREWVTVRSSVPRTEAPVVRALLESHGIATLMEPQHQGISYRSPSDATHYRLRVGAEDVERAEELLG